MPWSNSAEFTGNPMIKPNRWVLICLVALAFLAPLKFGTPVVLQSLAPLPAGVGEWIFFNWPNQLATMFVFGTLIWIVADPHRMRACVDALFALPILWVATQALAAPGSVCRQVTADTVLLFATCVLVFYAAAWYARDGAAAMRIFSALGCATLIVVVVALDQAFGGLNETRDFAAQSPNAAEIPADLKLKLTSNRVFGTLVNPNTLAGYLVVAFGPVLAWIWVRGRGWDARVKWAALVLAGGLMVWCMMLTGSRGGLVALIAAALAGAACVAGTVARRVLWGTLAAAVVVAAVFLATHQRGTSSMAARRDYWQGAMAIARENLWLGTGPGTFGSVYPMYKTGTNEEAQLAHNNYLQMWSDSGVLAFLVFTGMWIVAIRDAFQLARQRIGDAAAVAICASLAGWAMHGLVDFDLYVPGIALPVFLLMGVLQGLKEVPEFKEARSHLHRRRLLGVIAVIAVGVVWWSQWRAVMAATRWDQAQQLAATGNLTEAQDAANQAILYMPYNPRFWAGAGDIAMGRREFDEASSRYAVAVKEDPFRAGYHFRRAQAELATGQLSVLGVNELRRAAELNPTKKEYQDALRAVEERVRQAGGGLVESAPTKEK
jgi:O-antigen ligase